MAEQMKSSRIDWIGDVPKSWDVEPIKYRVSFYNGDRSENYPSKNEIQSEGIPFINAGHIEGNCLNMNDMDYISEEKYRVMGGVKLQQGDILYCLRGSVGKNIIVNIDKGTVASSLVAIRSNGILNKYLYYCLNSNVEEVQRCLWDNGTAQSNLSADSLGKFKICIPPDNEQQAIADFLDKECAQIDSIAADLEKQIALLQQYKKSLITETVTKGLDKSVPMKDSGIEWIGKIPAHWDFKRLKFMLENSSDSMKVGPFGSALSGSDFTDEGKWVYNQRVVLDNNFSENTTFVSEEKFQEMRGFAVYPGDILITTRGTIGKVAIVPEGANEGILHPCIIKFRVDKEMIIPELLQLIFNESDFVKDQFTLMSNATTIEVIYSYSLKDILLPVIPADEQEKIYGYLSKKCIAIDGIIAEKQKALATITKHKKFLIYEYVTGKKRVKEVQ